MAWYFINHRDNLLFTASILWSVSKIQVQDCILHISGG